MSHKSLHRMIPLSNLTLFTDAEAIVIDKGKVVHRQDTASLVVNEDIRRRYLAM